jgi:dephospho-CoA kinase
MKSKQTPFTIGVTGGIGSGKTTVCKIIEKLGFPVFYSDLEAKNLMLHSAHVISAVKHVFGESAYTGGQLNRPHLAQIVFNNPSLLNELNQIIHPEVRKAFDAFVQENVNQKLVFNEAAILFETGAYKNFDFTILVSAPIELRVKRVCERDHVSEKDVVKRIQNQWPDEKKIPLANFVIHNDQQALQPQIESVLNMLLAKVVR